jgi:secreted trypsin-like serine protease
MKIALQNLSVVVFLLIVTITTFSVFPQESLSISVAASLVAIIIIELYGIFHTTLKFSKFEGAYKGYGYQNDTEPDNMGYNRLNIWVVLGLISKWVTTIQHREKLPTI